MLFTPFAIPKLFVHFGRRVWENPREVAFTPGEIERRLSARAGLLRNRWQEIHTEERHGELFEWLPDAPNMPQAITQVSAASGIRQRYSVPMEEGVGRGRTLEGLVA